MSAELVIEIYDEQSAAELDRLVQIDIDKQGFYNGHDTYCGCWANKIGFTEHDRVFASPKEAEDFIADNTDKWDDDLAAVKFFVVEDNARLTKLGDNIKDIQKTIQETKSLLHDYAFGSSESVYETAFKRIKSQSSKFKTCGTCESKISISSLKSKQCPVCGNKDFLLNQSDFKRIDSINSKLKALEEKLLKAEKERREYEVDLLSRNKTKTKWMVGGWCPS